MFAGINALLAVFVWFCVPETKNVSLEEMDVKFGGANHVEKGGDLMGVEDSHHASIDPLSKHPQAEHIQEVRSESKL